MKKILIGLIVGIFFGGAVTVYADAIFSDISGKEWFFVNFDNVTKKEIIKGYPDGTFKPSNSVSRAELVAIIDRTQNYEHARELAFAFLDWSNEQEPSQEISIGGTPVITSGGNAGGYSDPEFGENAINIIAKLIEGKKDENIYHCLYVLKKKAPASGCNFIGKIATKNTEFGIE